MCRWISLVPSQIRSTRASPFKGMEAVAIEDVSLMEAALRDLGPWRLTGLRAGKDRFV
jgi:hypothetical protein